MTPIVARVSADIVAPLISRHGTDWKTLIDEFLGKGKVDKCIDDGEHRRAVFALLENPRAVAAPQSLFTGAIRMRPSATGRCLRCSPARFRSIAGS